MSKDRYQIQNSVSSSYFEFISEGIKGSVVKVVQYSLIDKHLLQWIFNTKKVIMSQQIKVKKGESTYNPSLDRFEKIDFFPNKTDLVRNKFEGRNIRKEIEELKDKEKTSQS